MEDMTSMISVLILLCGLYCLYAAVMMKAKGIINQTILLGKETRLKKCKDKEGYIRKMFPHLLLMGVVTTASGVVDLINTYVVDIYRANTVMLLIFVAEFLWFSKTSMDARKEFY